MSRQLASFGKAAGLSKRALRLTKRDVSAFQLEFSDDPQFNLLFLLYGAACKAQKKNIVWLSPRFFKTNQPHEIYSFCFPSWDISSSSTLYPYWNRVMSGNRRWRQEILLVLFFLDVGVGGGDDGRRLQLEVPPPDSTTSYAPEQLTWVVGDVDERSFYNQIKKWK